MTDGHCARPSQSPIPISSLTLLTPSINESIDPGRCMLWTAFIDRNRAADHGNAQNNELWSPAFIFLNLTGGPKQSDKWVALGVSNS